MKRSLSTIFYFVLMFLQCNCNDFNYIRDKQQKCVIFICGTDYYPICGSDGKTYQNFCKFGQAQCLNPKLSIFLQGTCEDTGSNVQPDNTASTYDISSSTDTDICGITEECNTEAKDPICASDGITYNNDCLFKQAYCKNKGLTVVSKGECVPLIVDEKCQYKICPLEEDALCASNGRTYRNMCEFEQVQCYRQDLRILHKGKCDDHNTQENGQVSCEWHCNTSDRPLCASDGETYKSICDFERAQCKNKGLKVYKFAPC